MKAVRKVGRQIAQLRRDLTAAIKELNNQAARKLAQGNYGASQEIVALAKAVQQFATETKEYNDRWKTIARHKAGPSQVETTPVWEYYRLVARGLVNLGGESRFEDIVNWIKKNAINDLKPGDLLDGSKGEPVWQRSVLKAKRPMVKEGFLNQVPVTGS